MVIITILKIATIPIIFFVPGYILSNILTKERIEKLDIETLFLQILGSILVSGWVGLTLAEIGYFSLFNLVVSLLIICGLLALRYDVTFDLMKYMRISLDRNMLAVVILVIITVILSFHPAEYILGNADAGVYVNTGINIVNTGSILIHDDLFKNQTNDFYDNFYKFAGFYVFDKLNGVISPQFLHLYPTWIAIFYSIFGLKSGLLITPLFGLLGVVSVYFAGKTIFNEHVGFIAALILATNVLQIWFSQYPTAEMLTQFLFFSGIYTLAKNVDNMQNRHLWFLSALSFGELFLTRIDVIFLLFVIFIFLVYNYALGNLNKIALFFLAPLIILFLQALIHTLFISKIYFEVVFNFVKLDTGILFLCIFVLFLILIFIVITKTFIRYLICKLFLFQNHLKTLLMTVIVLLSIYAFFFRPYTDNPEEIFLYGKIVRTYNEENLIRLGWYLSDLGLLLAISGCILLIWKEWNHETYVLLSTGIIFSIFFIYDIKNNPQQIYAMRRYVPVVLPSFMLWTSYFIYQIYKKGAFYKLFSMIIVSIVSSYIFSDGYISIVNHTEHLGAIDQIDSLAKTFRKDNNNIVIFMEGDSNVIGTPLQYMYNINSLTSRDSNRTVLNDTISRWISNDKNIYIISSSDDIGIFDTLKLTLDTNKMVSIPALENVYDRKPSKIIMSNISYWMYKVEKLNNSDMLSFLDIGYDDYGLIEGFHSAEKSNITYRWTSKYSDILLPIDSSKNNSISIRMNSARPQTLSHNADLIIYVDNQTIANLSIGNTFGVYSIHIPPEFTRNKDHIILTIETTNTWKPSNVLNSSDSRELGIMIDWIKVNSIDKNIYQRKQP